MSKASASQKLMPHTVVSVPCWLVCVCVSTGPCMTFETACSSSLVGIATAAASLRNGDCEMAIVAAGNRLSDKDFTLGLQVGR